jgi:hypothetical protein
MADQKQYTYLVNFVIDVKRTDGEVLNDHENEMVQEMRVATENAIAEIMKNHGQDNHKNLGHETVMY